MELSRRKVVCCGQLTLHWTLDHCSDNGHQGEYIDHAVTRQQNLKTEILPIFKLAVVECRAVVALQLSLLNSLR